MKILSMSLANPVTRQYQLASQRAVAQEGDTFTRTTEPNTPSFKGAEVNVYKKILDNPTLTQKFMALVTAASATIVALAEGGNEGSELNTDSGKMTNPFTDFFGGMFQPKVQEQKDEATEQLLKQYKEENESLKAQLKALGGIRENDTAQKEEVVIPEVVDSEIPEVEDSGNNSKVTINFPKKHGRLSRAQGELKQITTDMKLTSDSASKLEAICQDLLANKSLVYGGNEVDCETLAKNFIQMLKSEENSAGKEQKITEFYNGYKGISGEENTESDNNAVNGESASGMTTQGSIVNGPKIVGKIDLNGTDRKPKRRFGIPAQSVGTSEQPAGTAEQTAEIEVKTFPTEPGSYIYYSPGTAPKGLLTNITNILLRFEKKVEDDYAAGALYLKDTKITSEPRWMHRPSAGYNITVEDLKKEIRQTNATHKYRGKYNYHRYNNINSSNINEVVEAINSDERFLKLFTLHAAGRLIDRFVDLDNNEVSIKEQASNLIDKLEEVIRKAIRQGGIIVEPSEDSKHGGNYRKYLAPILRIPTEFFINDQESAKIFGTNELQIDLCEYQPVSNYYRTKNKQALICTIYSKGI